MLDQAFNTVYTKFKLHFYQKVFSRFENREATLTTVESFCMEGIMALGSPTVAQFAQAMHISTPNASYKINSLIQKGYVQKVRSETDRREYHLCPTQKYLDYYNISYAYLQTVVDRVKARFSPEDVARGELRSAIGEEQAALLCRYLNLYGYGEALIQQYGGELTDYGLLTRADSQPVQEPLPPQPKLGGMEMR